MSRSPRRFRVKHSVELLTLHHVIRGGEKFRYVDRSVSECIEQSSRALGRRDGRFPGSPSTTRCFLSPSATRGCRGQASRRRPQQQFPQALRAHPPQSGCALTPHVPALLISGVDETGPSGRNGAVNPAMDSRFVVRRGGES
jgi:hypothetical protein